MSESTTIAELLQQTMVGDTNSIKVAEEGLMALESDMNFINHLLMVACEQNYPYNIQKAAIVYSKTYARHCYSHFNNQHFINNLADHLIKFMANTQLNLHFRKYAASTMDFILSSDKQNKVRDILFPKVVPIIQSALLSNGNNFDPIFLGLYIQTLLSSSPHVTRQIIIFFKNAFLGFTQVSIYLMKFLNQSLASENRDKILLDLNVIKIYSYVFKLFSRKFSVFSAQTSQILFDNSLTQLLNLAFNFNMPANQLKTTLFFQKLNTDGEVAEIFHSVKSDYIVGIKNIIRSLTTHIKDPKILATNEIIKKPHLISSLVFGLGELLGFMPYEKIKSSSLLRLCEEIYDLLLAAIKCNLYYSDFIELKKPLFEGCILKTLLLNGEDYDNYFYMPEEFLNSLLHVIDKDSTDFLKIRKNQTGYEDNQGDIENYDSLRTVAATLLAELAYKLDGLLSQIFNFVLGLLQSKQEPEYPHTLLFIILGVLRDRTQMRPDLHQKVVEMFINIMSKYELPQKVREVEDMSLASKEQNINLSVVLIVMMKYITTSKKLEMPLLSAAWSITNNILVQKELAESLKLIAFDMVQVLCQFPEYKFVYKFVDLFNNLMANPQELLIDKLLETLFQMFKMCDQELSEQPDLVIKTINNLAWVIERELTKSNCINKIVINKSWNVITTVCENERFIPKMIPEIENAILPLIQHIDGHKSDFQENIFMMLVSFIQKSQAITKNQLQMFDIIPKLFYSAYEKKFGQTFETLQIFMLYGKDILFNNMAAIKTIIEMAIMAMNTFNQNAFNEADHCEGVLILHSLILACGKVFDQEIWLTISNALMNRLESHPPKNNFLQANILAGFALVLMLGKGSFTDPEKEIFLSKILQNYGCFTVDYAPKILIISLSEMLTFVDEGFMVNSLTFMIDCLIDLLQQQRNNSFLFRNKKESREEKDYENAIRMMKNMMMGMDELDYFKTKIQHLKKCYPSLLQQALGQLPELKKDFLRETLSTTKIQNQNRRIFKIKRQS